MYLRWWDFRGREEMTGNLDEIKLDVVQAPADYKLLVGAGPGKGKTEVACARIEWLLRNGVSPERTLVFSFTRAAITELHSRTRRYAESEESVVGVRITTLDAEAWRICFGFRKDTGWESVFGDFDANIGSVLTLLTK